MLIPKINLCCLNSVYVFANILCQVAELLLAKGASVHSLDSRNRTSLHYTAINDAIDVARLLAENGVLINSKYAHWCNFINWNFYVFSISLNKSKVICLQEIAIKMCAGTYFVSENFKKVCFYSGLLLVLTSNKEFVVQDCEHTYLISPQGRKGINSPSLSS